MKEKELEETVVKEMGKMAYGALMEAGKGKGLYLEFCRHKDTQKLVPVLMMVLGSKPDGVTQVQPIAVLDLDLLDKVEPPTDAIVEECFCEPGVGLN